MYQSDLGQIFLTFLALEKARAVDQLVYTDTIDTITLTKARVTVANIDMILNLPDWLEKFKTEEIGKEKVIQSYSDI